MEETLATMLLDKVKELEERVKKLEEEKLQNLNGKRKIHQPKDKTFKIAPKRIVIAFVEIIEEADQYFDFMEYLKREIDLKLNSDPDCIFNTIAQRRIRKERFEKLDDELIWNAIEDQILKMNDFQKSRGLCNYRKYLTCCRFIKPSSSIENDIHLIGQWDMFPGLSFNQMERELEKYKALLSSSFPKESIAKYRENAEKEFTCEQEKLGYSFTDVIYDIVFRSRHVQYVMDQDPEMELEKLAELCPRIYGILYPKLRRMMKPDHARTLKVEEVPPHACVDDVRESFSCRGDIESVEMEREKTSQTAYVTYKESEAAKFAVDTVSPRVCNLDVRIYPVLYYRTIGCSDSQPKYVKSKPSEELFSSMREKAFKKYSELIARHADGHKQCG